MESLQKRKDEMTMLLLLTLKRQDFKTSYGLDTKAEPEPEPEPEP
jgi:hypothetical protein